MAQQMGNQPLIVLSEDSQRTSGEDAQSMNITAGKAVAESVRTTLGPKGMDKMLVDSTGEVVVTNDGVTILKEMDIEHPAANMIVEVAETQENEVGDGTTSAVIVAGELLDEAEDLSYAALRYFNAAGAAGPNQGEDHAPETHLIPIVLEVALGQRDKIVIFGDDYDTPDGTCVRDYVHVLDLAQAHVLALNALDDGSRVYNLGNGKGYSVREVIETARRVTGHEIPAEEGAPRPGDPPVLIASSDKIREELGWAPEHSALDDIIGSAWEWHRRHPNGYDGLQ